MDMLPGAIGCPAADPKSPTLVLVHGLPGWQIVGDHAPRASRPKHVEDGVDYFTQIDASWSSAGLGCR